MIHLSEPFVPDDVSRESAEHVTEHKVDHLTDKVDAAALKAQEAAGLANKTEAKIDELLEYAVTTAAEGLLKSAVAQENTANILGHQAEIIGMQSKAIAKLRTDSRVHSVLLGSVAFLAGLSLFSLLHYTVPNSQRLIDCTTPSTPAHRHPCNDNSARFGFNLSNAIVKCTKNLPPVVHTDDVRMCLYDSLGIKAQYNTTPEQPRSTP